MTSKINSRQILECIVDTAQKNLALNDDFIIDIEDAEFIADGYLTQYKSAIARDVNQVDDLEEFDSVLCHQAMLAIVLSKVLTEYLVEVRRQIELNNELTDATKTEYTFRKQV